MTVQVIDEPEQHRFAVREEGGEAELIYRAEPERLILVHTEVPPQLGGRGIAAALVEAALDRARRTGEVIVPWCPYARRWIREHAERAEGVTVDWVTAPPQS
jgi:predicted GNAT family acetyltransferase